jgi:hypothetical protein
MYNCACPETNRFGHKLSVQPSAQFDLTENRAQKEIGVTEGWQVPKFWKLTRDLPNVVFPYVEMFDCKSSVDRGISEFDNAPFDQAT